MTKPKPSATSPELMKAFDVIAKLKPRTKRKPKDPLAAVRRKHPGPWCVGRGKSLAGVTMWHVFDANNRCVEASLGWQSIARAIARMGNEK